VVILWAWAITPRAVSVVATVVIASPPSSVRLNG
jgi:hypothetical protein